MQPFSSVPQAGSRASEERGAILILMTILAAVLLAVIGLAVDAGTLYRGQLWLQKSVDAGALSGVGVTAFQSEVLPTEPAELKQFIETRAEQVAYLNLLRSGLPIRRSDISATFVSDPSGATKLPRLEVRAQGDIPLYLLQHVPASLFGATSTEATRRLEAVAVTQRRTANVVLVLDISSSMQCPAEGSCDCLTPRRVQADGSVLSCADEAYQNGTVQKREALVAAVQDFVSRFDSQRDRISLVVFNTTAEIAVPFRTVDSSSGRAAFGFNINTNEMFPGVGIIPKLASYRNGGNTNVCDGFMRAYQAVQEAGLVDKHGKAKEDVAYVYFSDGAPTAGRFLLSGAAAGALPVHDPLNFGNGAGKDYIHYSLQWLDPESGKSYPGPSPFVPTGSVAFNDVPNILPASGKHAACSTVPPPHSEAAYEGYFAGCIDSMESHLPGKPQDLYASDFKTPRLATLVSTGDLEHPRSGGWQEMYYYCAIEMADFLREKRGLVFSLGWGQPTAAGGALQNPADGLSLKQHFMARAANDYLLAVDNRERAELSAFPEPNYSGYQPYASTRKTSHGDYIEAPQGEEGLQSMFSRVAVQILLRLVA